MARATQRIAWFTTFAVITGLAWLAASAINSRVATWLEVPADKTSALAEKRETARKQREKAQGRKAGKETAANDMAPPAPGQEAVPPVPSLPESPEPSPLTGQEDEGGEAEAVADGGPSLPPTSLSGYLTPILARSLFNSATVGASAAGGGEGGEGGSSMARSDLSAELLGTMVSADLRYSTALLKVGTGLPFVYRIGDKIEDATLDFIDRKRVEVVRSNGEREEISMGSEGNQAKASGDRPARNEEEKGGRHGWEGIKDLGNNRFQIERAELEYAIANLDSMSKDARLLPNFQNGQSSGFKVSAIKRDSVFRKLGVKNNDVLMSVNGNTLSAGNALDLYSKLSNSKILSLDILRRGEPVTLEYEIK